MQSDNSRKEVCVLALACTPREKQSVAARFCPVLPDLWLNYYPPFFLYIMSLNGRFDHSVNLGYV